MSSHGQSTHGVDVDPLDDDDLQPTVLVYDEADGGAAEPVATQREVFVDEDAVT